MTTDPNPAGAGESPAPAGVRLQEDWESAILALSDAGASWAKARKQEREAARVVRAAIVRAAEQGITEVEMAGRVGANRRTVRRAAGKG